MSRPRICNCESNSCRTCRLRKLNTASKQRRKEEDARSLRAVRATPRPTGICQIQRTSADKLAELVNRLIVNI